MTRGSARLASCPLWSNPPKAQDNCDIQGFLDKRYGHLYAPGQLSLPLVNRAAIAAPAAELPNKRMGIPARLLCTL